MTYRDKKKRTREIFAELHEIFDEVTIILSSRLPAELLFMIAELLMLSLNPLSDPYTDFHESTAASFRLRMTTDPYYWRISATE